MLSSRQGIMERPIKKYHMRNEQSADRTYDIQQKMLEKKKTRLNDIMDHRKSCFFGGPEVQRALQKNYAAQVGMDQEVRKIRATVQRSASIKQDKTNLAIQDRFHQTYEGRRAMARQNEKQAMMDNFKMFERKKSQNYLDKLADIELDRKHLRSGPYAMSYNGR